MRRLQRRRARDLAGAFVVEGEDLVLAGIETGARARVLLVDAKRVPDLDPAVVGCPIEPVEPTLLASVSELGHPPRVIGVFDQPRTRDLAVALDERSRSGITGPWIALDGLGDPGNVGTILRSAAALGAGGIVTFPGTADPFGPKAARASMGACFRTPVARLDGSDVSVADELAAVRAARPDLRVVVLDAGGDSSLAEVELDSSTIVVVGSERDGPSDGARDAADVVAAIPQDPRVESINAAVAASLALYEWRRGASNA